MKTPSSIDEKNDQLKSSLKEVGSLLQQLEQGNQLNLISQDNKENLLQLKDDPQQSYSTIHQ